MQQVGIIGAGWLGLPLAQALRARGDHVVLTCTTQDKCNQLRAAHWQVQCYRAGEGQDWPLTGCSSLVVAIAPSKAGDYLAAIREIAHQAKHHGVGRLLLVSATSVYAPGQSEADTPRATGERAERLLAAEQMVWQSGIASVSVLRPAGLYGPGRHPGRFLAGKQTSGELSAVNLVHLDDVVAACLLLLDAPTLAPAYMLSAPGHPHRGEFYRRASEMLGLDAPCFIPPQGSFHPLTGERICRELGFTYRWPDPMVWLEHERDEVCQGRDRAL